MTRTQYSHLTDAELLSELDEQRQTNPALDEALSRVEQLSEDVESLREEVESCYLGDD